MIVFDLICSKKHIFEGWFSSSKDYELQKNQGFLLCPQCGSADINKSVMAPNLGLKDNQKTASHLDIPTIEKENIIEGPKQSQHDIAADDNRQLTNMDQPKQAAINKAMIDAIARVQEKALENSAWVGTKFAQEARSMHYGEADKRQIHGHATEKEAAKLSDEGIDIAALPIPYIPPDMKN